jgi:hypothetical protein
MAFMEPQIEQGRWYAIETDGTEYVPMDVIGDLGIAVGESAADWDDESESRWPEIEKAIRPYVDGTPHEVSLVEGFGARLSAPGYLDCTEWSVFPTEQEARDYLRDELGIDDKLGAMDRNDLLAILEEHDPEIDTDRSTEGLRDLISRMIDDGEIDSDDL